MAVASTRDDPGSGSNVFRCVGSLTIARAGSTQRELEDAPDPLTIDLSGVEKIDTVGAWLIYRATRDRGAKVVGASEDVAGLLEQVADADHPVRVRPDERSGPMRTLDELGRNAAGCEATRPRRFASRRCHRLRCGYTDRYRSPRQPPCAVR